MLLAGVAFAVAGVTNGGFETGTLSGWTVANNNPLGGPGSWFAYTGTAPPVTPPFFGFTIPAPPEGTFGAVTDAGPGAHIIDQDLEIPDDAETISFYVFYENRSLPFGGPALFFTPDNLDPNLGTFFGPNPNQQYRIDLIDPEAPVDSLDPQDVLLNLFRTSVGDPPSLAPTLVTVDISEFENETVRLRLAEVDNIFFLHAGVDGISILVEDDEEDSDDDED